MSWVRPLPRCSYKHPKPHRPMPCCPCSRHYTLVALMQSEIGCKIIGQRGGKDYASVVHIAMSVAKNFVLAANNAL